MKKLVILLCIFLPLKNVAQFGYPSLHDVAYRFLAHYEHDQFESLLFFSREQDGWHVRRKQYGPEPDTSRRELFWSLSEKKFMDISYERKSQPQLPEDAADILNDAATYNGGGYGFERCIYFGYPGWAADVIRDFGHNIPANDTLAESLARACMEQARYYTFREFKFNGYTEDPLLAPLPNGQLPSAERIRKYTTLQERSVAVYKAIHERNPGYQVIVGPVSAKVFAEQVEGFYMLQRMEQPEQASAFLNNIQPDSAVIKYGKNYLAGLPKNTILFTYGDMDTYPLIYLQEQYNYRKDVTVLNVSLLSSASFLNYLKKRPEKILFKTPASFFNDNQNEYFFYKVDGAAPKTAPLSSLVNQLLSGKIQVPVTNGNRKGYSIKNAEYPIPAKYNTNVLPAGLAGNRVYFVPYDILLTGDLVILDIINQNILKRPVYFTDTSDNRCINSANFVREGLYYRLLPLNNKTRSNKVKQYSVAKTAEYINRHYAQAFDASKKITDQENSLQIDRYLGLYLHICGYYIEQNNIPEAKKWINKFLGFFKDGRVNTLSSTAGLVFVLAETSDYRTAKSIAEHFCREITEAAAPPHLGREQKRAYIAAILQSMQSVLDEKGISSPLLNKMIEQFSEQ